MKRIESFQGLRALAFIAILMSHTIGSSYEALAAWGVSTFLGLSGFLMMYSYYPRQETPRFGLRFAWKKIQKLYPLHIVMMICAGACEIIYGHAAVSRVLKKFLLHIPLLQSWAPYPEIYGTLNGVSWYLSSVFFSYLLFPLILKKFKKVNKKQQGGVGILLVLVIEMMIAAAAGLIGNPDKSMPFSIQWIVYCCPVARLFDFLAGCCVGYLFLQKADDAGAPKSKGANPYTLVEIAVILLLCAAKGIYSQAFQRPWHESVKYTLLFQPITAVTLWCVARGRGLLSRILQNKGLVWLGNMDSFLNSGQ